MRRAVVEDESVVLLRYELDARVTVLALRQGRVPRPAVAVETVPRLLAARPIELVIAGASVSCQYQNLSINTSL